MTQVFKAYEIGAAKGIEDHVAFMEPTPKRVRVMLAGEMIADSDRVLIMYETKHLPIYYFPMDDVRMELMELTDRSTF